MSTKPQSTSENHAAAHEQVQLIHRVIQNTPEENRTDIFRRVKALLLTLPNPEAMAEIMDCLEPGFAAMEGRA